MTMMFGGLAVAASVGRYHTVVLKGDGSVAAWGNNNSLQCDVPAAINNNAQAVAAGDHFSLALLLDGTVVAWGDNTYGQCDVPAGL